VCFPTLILTSVSRRAFLVDSIRCMKMKWLRCSASFYITTIDKKGIEVSFSQVNLDNWLTWSYCCYGAMILLLHNHTTSTCLTLTSSISPRTGLIWGDGWLAGIDADDGASAMLNLPVLVPNQTTLPSWSRENRHHFKWRCRTFFLCSYSRSPFTWGKHTSTCKTTALALTAWRFNDTPRSPQASQDGILESGGQWM